MNCDEARRTITAIQTLLGTEPDGKIGPQTREALDALHNIAWKIPTQPAPSSHEPQPFPRDFLNFVEELEGFSPKPFGDYKQRSIGFGTVARPDDTTICRNEAEARLIGELTKHAARIDDSGAVLRPREREALISFDYNTGAGLAVLKKAGNNFHAATAWMQKYVYAGGGVLEGLVKRREAEFAWAQKS